MHKDTPVIDITVEDTTGKITQLGTMRDYARLPFGLWDDQYAMCLAAFNRWWLTRSIPQHRKGLDKALPRLGGSVQALLTKSYGFCLTDYYWIKPERSSMTWKGNNFFTNLFSLDVGNILLDYATDPTVELEFNSPDITTEGLLRKRWIIAGGRRVLAKGGFYSLKQEPFNEIIASKLCKAVGIDCVEYILMYMKGNPYSLCENMLNENTEFVPAGRFVKLSRKSNHESLYAHLIRTAFEQGLGDITQEINKMIILDYIIGNHDRHWANFGFIRDVDTLKWIRLAPMFDNGSSLWHNTECIGIDTPSKAFCMTNKDQLRCVTDLSWFKLSAFQGIDAEIIGVYAQAEKVNKERAMRIAGAVLDRAEHIENFKAGVKE
jgi:hypothetical protein